MQAEKKKHVLFQIKAESSAYEALGEIRPFSKDCTAVSLAGVCHETRWTPNTRYLLVPLISFAFVHHGPALSDLHLYVTALREEGTVLGNCSSCHPDWSAFEPGASLLSLIRIPNKDTARPAAGPTPTCPSEVPRTHRARLGFEFLSPAALPDLVTAHLQHIKSFWASWNLWWKSPVGCKRNVNKYRSYVLNANQLHNVNKPFQYWKTR